MKQLNIKEYNIKELIEEGRLTSNLGKYFDNNPKFEKNGKLGCVKIGGRSIQGFTIAEWESVFYEDVKISAYAAEPSLSMHFMLKGENGFEINKQDPLFVSQGTNNICSLSSGYFGNQFVKKDQHSKSIGIYIHQSFLEKLTERYPAMLSNLYQRCMNDETFFTHQRYLNTTFEMEQILYQIQNAHLLGNAGDIYTEAKILELLAFQLRNNSLRKKRKCNKHCKTSGDIEKIHEAGKILTEDLNHSMSIRQLARNVGINENKLKYGFKETFNTTVFGYLFNYKMDYACKLLADTNKNMLEIASICGYTYASHFTTAFKRKYGITPKEFRKKFN